jgi:putative ABC transport system ATP-binding protein
VPVTALNGIDVNFYPSEFCALQGPSGSGKSTLLNILGLLESPTEGTCLFDKVDTGKLSERELTLLRRLAIGFIFQNFNLISTLSALENVEYPLFLEHRLSAKQVRDEAREALSSVGLGDFERHRPAQLSGGQRQRVAIARAVVKRPRVILADEPTANLDSKTALQIIELLQTIKQKFKTSLIVATHDIQIAQMADRKVLLKDGKVDESSHVPAERSNDIQARNPESRIET